MVSLKIICTNYILGDNIFILHADATLLLERSTFLNGELFNSQDLNPGKVNILDSCIDVKYYQSEKSRVLALWTPNLSFPDTSCP